MENLDIYSLIDKSLKYYDKQNTKYRKFIDNNNVSFNRDKVEIYFNDGEEKETFKYQGAGIFDGFTKIWLWAWLDPHIRKKESELAKSLLSYGLNQETDTITNTKTSLDDIKLFLKTQLVNSRFIVENFFHLDIFLALITYLVKDNIKFIYPRKRFTDREKTKYIINYYYII